MPVSEQVTLRLAHEDDLPMLEELTPGSRCDGRIPVVRLASPAALAARLG